VRRTWSTAVAAALLVVFFAGCEPPKGQPVPDTVIDFEEETDGGKPNGYTPADSAAVHFQDTNGAELAVGDFGGGGSHQLFVGSDFDGSGIRILLDRPTNRLSLRFGNDDASTTEAGDEATLTVFRGTTQVGQTRVVMNRNDLMDQTISFQNGPLFNRAVIKYDVDPLIGASELIDDIVIGPLCTVAGTEAGETLTGTSGADVICGGGGNDTVFGRGGPDHITGGNGADTLNGEDGADFIAGNFGGDTLRGGNQNDRLEGGEQNDQLFGNAGDDDLFGGNGSDTCNGGSGSTVFGSCETQVA
jgi:Ca2+-binding RTX toxin-like protein